MNKLYYHFINLVSKCKTKPKWFQERAGSGILFTFQSQLKNTRKRLSSGSQTVVLGPLGFAKDMDWVRKCVLKKYSSTHHGLISNNQRFKFNPDMVCNDHQHPKATT